MEPFAKIILFQIAIFAIHSILDVLQGSEYASDYIGYMTFSISTWSNLLNYNLGFISFVIKNSVVSAVIIFAFVNEYLKQKLSANFQFSRSFFYFVAINLVIACNWKELSCWLLFDSFIKFLKGFFQSSLKLSPNFSLPLHVLKIVFCSMKTIDKLTTDSNKNKKNKT